MTPEYGSTCTLFPVDDKTLDYLRLTGRSEEQIALVEAYAKAQGFWNDPEAEERVYAKVLELDLSSVTRSVAGPSRPHDRIDLSQSKQAFERICSERNLDCEKTVSVSLMGETHQLTHGALAIAAVTSCTTATDASMMLAAGLLARKDIVVSIENTPADDAGGLYPLNMYKNWTTDNYGPVWIPKKGETVKLTIENLPVYERPIHVYEGNELAVKDGKIYINGKETDEYTFKMDYYWMMGDNRHNSADSRFWGFVPEDHVVGKPIFIWLSLDNDRGWLDGKIRWNRLFTFVDNIK